MSGKQQCHNGQTEDADPELGDRHYPWLFIFYLQQLISYRKENRLVFSCKVRLNFRKEKSTFWAEQQNHDVIGSKVSSGKHRTLFEDHKVKVTSDACGSLKTFCTSHKFQQCVHHGRQQHKLKAPTLATSVPPTLPFLSQSCFLPVILPTVASLGTIPRESASSTRRLVSCKAALTESPQSAGRLLHF